MLSICDQMTARRTILLGCVALSIALSMGPRRVLAQPTGALPRVAMLYPGLPEQDNKLAEAFLRGMRGSGYVDGRDFVFDLRYVGTRGGAWEQLERVLAELLELRSDVIVTVGSQGAWAAKRATSTIPVVMATVGDPVGQGLVASLAQPGGNITGNAILSEATAVKRLELPHEVLPKARKIGILTNQSNPLAVATLRRLEGAAKQLKLILMPFDAASASLVDAALGQIARQRPDALMVQQDSVFYLTRSKIVQSMLRERIPAIYSFKEAVGEGGLISYANSSEAMFKRAAMFVVRILKGSKPSNLPIEQPTQFELAINLRTAKILGLTIPQSVLLRADRST